MLAKLSVASFLEQTASSAPVPGGGSVAALSLAAGASLAQMVANVTVGRKKYEAVEAEMQEIAQGAQELKEYFTAAIDRDAAAFNEVMAAMKLPKETEEEKAARRAAMETAFQEAARVPFQVAEKGLSLMPLLEAVVQKGNQNAVTDGAVGAMMVRTGILAALYNVEINLTSISDLAFVQELQEKLTGLREQAIQAEQQVLSKVKI